MKLHQKTSKIYNKRKFASKFKSAMKEKFIFAKGWVKNPLQSGALFPTSSIFAKRISSVADYSGAILELGPGLGNITEELVKHTNNLICIEIEDRFYQHMKNKFPHLSLIKGSAEYMEELLPDLVGKVKCIVSLIPMVSLKPAIRQKILFSCLNMLEEGGFLLQGSYYWKPITKHPNFHIEHVDFIWRNLPPIHIYKYTKTTQIL